MNEPDLKDALPWMIVPFEALDRLGAAEEISLTARRAAKLLLARLELDPLDEPRVEPTGDGKGSVSLVWEASHHIVTARPALMAETQHRHRRVAAWVWAREKGKACWLDDVFPDAEHRLRDALARAYPTLEARRKMPGINPAEESAVRELVRRIRADGVRLVAAGREYLVYNGTRYRILAENCVAQILEAR